MRFIEKSMTNEDILQALGASRECCVYSDEDGKDLTPDGWKAFDTLKQILFELERAGCIKKVDEDELDERFFGNCY